MLTAGHNYYWTFTSNCNDCTTWQQCQRTWVAGTCIFVRKIFTSPPLGQRSIVMTVSVCLSASISPELHVRSSSIFVHATYGSGSVLLWQRCDMYVFPVLWMTSCLYILARNGRRNSDSVWSSTDLSPWRILRLTHQRAAPERGRSLISTSALWSLSVLLLVVVVESFLVLLRHLDYFLKILYCCCFVKWYA